MKTITGLYPMKTMQTIGTHPGPFHADETLAVACLRRMFNHHMALVRSRDPKELAECDLLVDVGGKYDGDRYFDHHQKGAPVRENGVPYAGAGLIWKRYGEEILTADFMEHHLGEACPSAMLVYMFERIDRFLFQPVDAADNGKELVTDSTPVFKDVFPMSLSMAVHCLNPSWHVDDRDDQGRFDEAVALLDRQLDAAIERAYGSWLAKEAFAKETKLVDGEILVLPRFFPWQEMLFEACASEDAVEAGGGAVAGDSFRNVQYVIFPDDQGTFLCQCVPTALGSFEKKKPLPEAWAGLRNEEFSKIAGVADGVFCHPGRFICGSKSLASTLVLAKTACQA